MNTNTISLSRAVVHVPAEPVVYDTASPAFRFLHRQWSRFRAVIAQKGLPEPLERLLAKRKPQPVVEYQGRHRREPGQELETRIIAADGTDTGQRLYWTPEPTLRDKIAHARAQRAARRNLAAAWMHTGAFPVLEDTGWILRQRQAQRLAPFAEVLRS